MKKLIKTILIGDGGHAASILSIIPTIRYELLGYCAPEKKSNYNRTYLGTDFDIITNYDPSDVNLILGISYVGSKVTLELRQNVINYFNNYSFHQIIARSSCVKADYIGAGTILFEKTIVNVGVHIGENSVINTGAIIEHHCKIGNNVQISPGALILGGVEIGDNTFIGAGVIVRDSVTIAANRIIPMGTNVVKDIL